MRSLDSPGTPKFRTGRFCWCQVLLSACFPPEVSETAAWNPIVQPSPKWWSLTSLSHLLSRWHISMFGHVARSDDNTPANVALQLHINVLLNWPPDHTWRRPPGRPRNKWLDQLWNDSTRPIGDLWRRAVDCGHGGATPRRPSSGTRPWRWCSFVQLLMHLNKGEDARVLLDSVTCIVSVP